MQSPSNVISAWITGLNVGQRTWKRNHGIINVMTRSYWWLSRLRISRSPQATQFTDKTVRSMCPPSVSRSRFSPLNGLDSLHFVMQITRAFSFKNRYVGWLCANLNSLYTNR